MSNASASSAFDPPESSSPASFRNDLLQQIAEQTTRNEARSPAHDRFVRESSDGEALRIWLGQRVFENKSALLRQLNCDVAIIDKLLNDQLNEILHHKSFQKLESTWRGVEFLTTRSDEEGDPAGIKIRVLDLKWKELENDFDRAIEFDQSQLFRKVYENEFGTPGGQPFGMIIGDYDVHPRISKDHPHDDVNILEAISGVAAAAFCPTILNVSPSMFGLNSFSGLQYTMDHADTFQRPEFLKWQSLRNNEDSRFIGLAMPRVLMRLPYKEDSGRVDGFRFSEDVSGPDHEKYLWGGAVFAFAAVAIRAYALSGWLADIRGVQRGMDVGGIVRGLPVHDFGTDSSGVSFKSSTDVVVTDQLEKQLSDLGFIPLVRCHDTEYSAFFSNQSIQKPRTYDRSAATTNAKISSMLQYMLCVSRFAHFVKAIGRDRVGGFTQATDVQKFLQNWLAQYVTPDASASPETKARFPLREASVTVKPKPGSSGSYDCIMRLVPHYELDDLAASVRLKTEITPLQAGS